MLREALVKRMFFCCDKRTKMTIWLQAKQRAIELEQQLAAAQAAAAEQQRKSEADAAVAVEQFQAQCEDIKTAATAAGHEAGGENPTPLPLSGRCILPQQGWRHTPD